MPANLVRGPTIRRNKRSALLLVAVQTAQDGGHLGGVLLLLLVLGPLRVLIGCLLRPVAVLLLDGKTFDVVCIHDLFDSLVVV